jgi:hypothetical protein
MRIIPMSSAALPAFKVVTERDESSETLRGRETSEGHIEYELFGDRTVIVQWEAKKSHSRSQKKTKNGRKGSKK